LQCHWKESPLKWRCIKTRNFIVFTFTVSNYLRLNQTEHDVDLFVLQNHLATCSCKIVSCLNKNCDIAMRRKNLKLHMTTTCQWRIIQCEHCSEPHPKCQMEVNMIRIQWVKNPKKIMCQRALHENSHWRPWETRKAKF